jgi:hypothetical protein
VLNAAACASAPPRFIVRWRRSTSAGCTRSTHVGADVEVILFVRLKPGLAVDGALEQRIKR